MGDRATTILRQRAERLARPPAVESRLDLALLAFRRSAQFAIPVESVSGVRPLGPLARLPGGPSWVSGLVAWRGGPIPAIDLSVLVGGEARTEPRHLVVVAAADGDIALVADEVTGVVACSRQEVGTVPAGAPEGAARIATGYLPAVGLVLDAGALAEAIADRLAGEENRR